MSEKQAKYKAENPSEGPDHYPFTPDEWETLEARILTTGCLWDGEPVKLIRMIRRLIAELAAARKLNAELSRFVGERFSDDKENPE